MRITKWTFNYLSKIKWMFFLSLFLLFIEAYAYISTISLQQKLIDEVILSGNNSLFYSVLLLIASVYLSYSLLFIVVPHLIFKNEAKVRLLLSKDLYKKLYKIKIENLQNTRIAHYVHIATQDVNKISNLLTDSIPRMVQDIFSTCIIILIISLSSPDLLLIILIICIIYFALGGIYGKQLNQVSKVAENRKSDLLVHLEEGISSTREVISYHREKWDAKIYNQKFHNYFEIIMKQGRIENKQEMINTPLKWCCNLTVLGYGGYMVIQGSLSIGMFVVIYQLITMLTSHIGGIFHHFINISTLAANVDRFLEAIKVPEESDGYENLENEIESINFNNIILNYKDMRILNNINMDFKGGKNIAIVGGSGGGKSTIVQLLIGYIEPDMGNIFVNNIPLANLKKEEWRNKVRVVFQEPYFFSNTIIQNLLIGNSNASNRMVKNVCKALSIHDFIMKLPNGYDTVIGERGITLSGGQRQRLAIARAVLKNPEVLILDEATSALDYRTERIILESLHLLRKGKTTITVAHRLSTIQDADEIFVIDKGKVIEKGTHNKLIQNNSFYKKLIESKPYETQSYSQL